MHSPDPAFIGLSDQLLLATLLYGEARGVSDEALAAVACSVRNRTTSGKWFGGTWAEVILRWAQYDALWPTMGGGNFISTRAFALRAKRLDYQPTANEQRVLNFASSCVTGKPGMIEDPTDGATHYYDESVRPPAWTAAPARETFVLDKLHFFAGVN